MLKILDACVTRIRHNEKMRRSLVNIFINHKLSATSL